MSIVFVRFILTEQQDLLTLFSFARSIVVIVDFGFFQLGSTLAINYVRSSCQQSTESGASFDAVGVDEGERREDL